MEKKKIKNDNLIAKIQHEFGFDERDLKANRDGKLSKRQRLYAWMVLLAYLILCSFLIIAGMGIIFFAEDPIPYFWFSDMRPAMPFIVSGVSLTLIYVFFHQLRKLFSSYPVKSFRGKLAFNPVLNGKKQIQLVHVRVFDHDSESGKLLSRKFVITQSEYDVMKSLKDPCIVYFTGRDKHIMSRELASVWDN